MINFIFGLFFGAVASFIIREILRGLLEDKVFKVAKEIRSRFLSSKTTNSKERLKIGHYSTEVFIIDGNGQSTFKPSTITAVYTDGAPNSPDDIADRIMAKDRELEQKRESGNNKVWDGIGVGISEYRIGRTNDENHLAMHISFYKSRYAAFQATVVEIGKENRDDPNSIYQKHLKNKDPSELIPYLARHVGVVVVVVTADNFAVATKRSARVAVRACEYDVSIVEGIEPTKDADTSDEIARINVYQTVIRGCNEELGFKPDISEISLLGLGVDMNYYQFNFIAVVRSPKTFDTIKSFRNGRARDAWESELHPVPFNTDSILEFMAKNQMWDIAMAAFYWSLTSEVSTTIVDARAAQFLSSKNRS